MDPLRANVAISADTARILSAVDAMMLNSSSIVLNGPQKLETGVVLTSLQRPKGEEPLPAPQPIPTRSVGIMCDGPRTCAVGVQYGEGCGWGVRATATNTDEVDSKDLVPAPVPQRTAVVDATLKSVSTASIQTVAPRTQHSSTDPIPMTTVGVLTDINGGDIVETGMMQHIFMQAMGAHCRNLERTISDTLTRLSQRITRARSTIHVAEHHIASTQSAVRSASTRNSALEKENKELKARILSLQEDTAIKEGELNTMRLLCEEMARNAEASNAEKERHRQHAAFLEQRFDSMLTSRMMSSSATEAKRTSRAPIDEPDDEFRSDSSTSSSCREPVEHATTDHHVQQASSTRPPRYRKAHSSSPLSERTTPPPMHSRNYHHPRGASSSPAIHAATPQPPQEVEEIMRSLYDQCTAALKLADDDDDDGM